MDSEDLQVYLDAGDSDVHNFVTVCSKIQYSVAWLILSKTATETMVKLLEVALYVWPQPMLSSKLFLRHNGFVAEFTSATSKANALPI